MENKHWYAVYIRPNWEKVVLRQLDSWYGIEGWAPFRKEKRQRHDRTIALEVPVFRGYVFVRVADEKERVKVLTLDGVLNYVRYLRKPAIIKDDVITELKAFIAAHTDIKVEQLEPGMAVTINEGPLQGKEGILRSVAKGKVVLELPLLGCKLTATVSSVRVRPWMMLGAKTG